MILEMVLYDLTLEFLAFVYLEGALCILLELITARSACVELSRNIFIAYIAS